MVEDLFQNKNMVEKTISYIYPKKEYPELLFLSKSLIYFQLTYALRATQYR